MGIEGCGSFSGKQLAMHMGLKPCMVSGPDRGVAFHYMPDLIAWGLDGGTDGGTGVDSLQ